MKNASTENRPAPDWDPTAPEVLRDQRAAYDAMRRRCPVAYSEFLGWSLFRHEDVLRVLLDHETFSNAVSRHLSVPNGMDPPEHTAYRRLIEPFFSAEPVAAFEPVCREIAANLTRLLLPALRRARGHVVFINSGAGFTGRAGWSAYAASKFGLRALADSLRAEENGVVKVTSIHPGRTATDMQRAVREFEGEPFDPKEFLSPEAVAATVRLALDAPTNASIDTLTIRPV